MAQESTQLKVKNPAGKDAGEVELDAAVFGLEPNVPVMHQVVTAQLAARRSGTQSTKTRAEVRGGGKKPWAQKGTGNARQGSIRAPHFTGGGVALGPKPRKYDQKTPKKMVKLATRSALSDRASEGKVVVVDSWNFDTPKTKSAKQALDALDVSGQILVVLGHDDTNAMLSFRNLTNVQVIAAGELNAYDVLCSDWVVFTKDSLPSADAPSAASKVETAAAVAAADERNDASGDSDDDGVADAVDPVAARRGLARPAPRRRDARGLPDQGQRRLDALPPSRHVVLQPHGRRGLVRQRGVGNGRRVHPACVAAQEGSRSS